VNLAISKSIISLDNTVAAVFVDGRVLLVAYPEQLAAVGHSEDVHMLEY